MNSDLPTIPRQLALLRRRSLPTLVASVITLAGELLAAGPTLVSGNVSGTWTPANNPYVLVDHCTVPSDKTLTIQPGTEIIIGQGLNLTVNGNILARGTASERIVFRAPNASTFWGSIVVNWNLRTSDVRHCAFEGATIALSINMDGGSSGTRTSRVEVVACRFSRVSQAAVVGFAQGRASQPGPGPVYTSHPTLNLAVLSCKFDDVKVGIWARTSGGSVQGNPGTGIVALEVENCIVQRTGGFAIQTEESPLSGRSDGWVHNSAFIRCQTALNLQPSFNCSVRNNVFADCEVGVKRTGTTSGQVGFNCFHNTTTKFSGYPSTYGTVALNNANGTPCDIAFNIFENPKFAETVSFLLAPDSPCVDAGDPAAAYNDVRFPPSRGKAVNDIGAYGGPNVLADDADLDDLLDSWEIQYFGNLETTDGASDPDQDGLINTREALYGTNPARADTDGDGFNDLAEVRAGTSATDPNSLPNFALGIQVVAYDLELATAAGRRYQLQASEGLGLWDSLFDPIVGDGNVVRKRVEVGETHYRFFKVRDITSP